MQTQKNIQCISEFYIILQCFPHIDWGRPGIFTAAQVYLVTHFCFYYYYYPLTLFLSTRENETIRNRLTIGKSPLALHVLYGSFCVLDNCRHSHRQAPVFPICSLWQAASTALCQQLPRDERDFSTIFSNFQTLLADFIHNRFILTTLAKKKKKP